MTKFEYLNIKKALDCIGLSLPFFLGFSSSGGGGGGSGGFGSSSTIGGQLASSGGGGGAGCMLHQ